MSSTSEVPAYAEPALPLAGVRVLDLGMVWAGPWAATLLGDLGADVVKVEGPTHPDPFRSMFGSADPASFPAGEILEWSPLYVSLNRNKRGVLLDLRDPAGAAACRELARAADVVIDNFSARVLPSLGLAPESLRAQNPRLVTCAMPGFGRTGPQRDAVTYGPIVEQLSGAMALSGYPGGEPVGQSGALDVIAGCHGALAAAAAVVQRLRTGVAPDVDLAQVEVGARLMAPYIADRQLGHPAYERNGNSDPDGAPHRCYRCAGDDAWVAISARRDVDFAHLAAALGHPEWPSDPRFAAAGDRRRNQAELDALIEAWTGDRTADQAAAALQAVGVVAAPLRSVHEVIVEPALCDRGAFVGVTRQPNGVREYQAPPLTLDGARLPVRRAAPRLGEHTDEVRAGWSDPGAPAIPAGPVTVDWLPPPAVDHAPLDGVRITVSGESDAVAVAASLLRDLGADVWRDARTIAAAQRRSVGAQLAWGHGMHAGAPPQAAHIRIADTTAPPAAIPIDDVIDDAAGAWRLDDLSACALSSLSWRVGDPGREPLQPGRGYPSATAGVLAALAAVALLAGALRGAAAPAPRRATVSLLESALLLGTFETAVVAFGGDPPGRRRRPWPALSFACRDGWVGIFPRTEEMWESLCAMTDAVELLADPELASFAGRQRYSERIGAAVAPWFAAHTRAEIDEAARAHRVPLAMVCDPLEVLDLPSHTARGLFVPVTAETGETVRLPGLPFLLQGRRLPVASAPPSNSRPRTPAAAPGAGRRPAAGRPHGATPSA